MEVTATGLNPSVAAEGLALRYGEREVFSGVSFTLLPGKSLALTGASGSGKSSILSMLLGLQRPSNGQVNLFGQPVDRLSQRQLREFRRSRIGMVFQSGELLPDLSPVDNVLVAALLAGVRRADAETEALRLLEQVDVPIDVPATHLLSGGERGRVAVARALVADPDLVLADEPTAALDRANRRHVRDLLLGLAKDRGKAVLIATHDDLVAEGADHVLTLGPS